MERAGAEDHRGTQSEEGRVNSEQAKRLIAATEELLHDTAVDMTEFLAGFGTWHAGGPDRYSENYGYDPYNHLGSNVRREQGR